MSKWFGEGLSQLSKAAGQTFCYHAETHSVLKTILLEICISCSVLYISDLLCSTLPATAAEKAAAVRAEAEAKLVASLNAGDANENSTNGAAAAQAVQVIWIVRSSPLVILTHFNSQQIDFSQSTREDLVQICTQRTLKLQQVFTTIPYAFTFMK